MSKNTYPLKLPSSIKNAAADLAKLDGVSLNQFIAAAVAEKVGTLRGAREFLQQRSGTAKPKDLLKYIRRGRSSHCLRALSAESIGRSVAN